MTALTYQQGCTCPSCVTRYITEHASSCTYGTNPRPRYAHAVPENSNVTLCGRKATTPTTGTAGRCPDCTRIAGQQNWVAR